VVGFNTGGYTGDFADEKLAFLHEKELVLNADDTKNILTAVSTLRAISPALISQIEKQLDNSSLAAMSMIASGLNVSSV
jgi:hypothetical protein